ncbi:hypothetical protein DIPPA_08607 [Diplonema papillatum]|nr:hypothetical protein DIPPA_08607 [Diplonema papillatum]
MRSYVIDPSELPFAEWSRQGMMVSYAVTVATMIMLMRLWYYSLSSDPLATPIFVSEYVSIDLWSFVHITFYIGVGFILPNQLIIGFLGGVLFEVLEALCAQTSVLDLHAFWKERGVNSAWDIVFNTVGFRIGQCLLVAYVYFNRTSNQAHEEEVTDNESAESTPEETPAERKQK